MFSWQESIMLIISFIAAGSALALAFYVYIKGPERALNRTYSYLALVSFSWSLADFFAIATHNLFWIKLAYAAGSLLPAAGFFFSYALVDKKPNTLQKIFFAVLSSFFVCVSFTPFFVKEIINFYPTGYDALWGPMHLAWVFFMTIVSPFCFLIAINARSRAQQNIKIQILYFILGIDTFCVWALIVCVVLPGLGFSQLYFLGSPAALFMITVISYGIIKNQLLGIRSLFFQAFMSSLVIVIIDIVLAGLMLLEFWFFTNAQPLGAFIVATLVAITGFFVGRAFFVKTNDLEKAKVNLIDLLEKSEENRRKAELERDKTATIINNFSDGLIIVNERKQIASINPEALKMLDLTANKLTNHPISFLQEFSKSKAIWSVLSAGLKNISRKEIELAKDFIIELSVSPLNLQQNEAGHLIVLHDVSREKSVERMKTEFVSLAAHQLRTPLSIIKWSMSMLKNEDFGKLNKKQGEVIKGAFNNNERLILLVNDLLNVTHLEEGVYLYKMEPADVRDVVMIVIDGQKELLDKEKISLEFKDPGLLPKTMIDASKIKLAIQNLIDNAIKYSSSGGKVLVTLGVEGENIKFKIKDSGLGIPKDQQDKIFTKFFRGANATKMRAIGSGLGLYLSKNIIEAHGGRIWFESQENVGTSFYFSLPIKNN